MVYVISLISFLWLWFSFWWIRIRGLWKLPKGRDWLRGKLGLVLMGGAMLPNSLIEFSVVGLGCGPSLLFDLRRNYGGGDEDNGSFLQKVPRRPCCAQCLGPCSRPPPTHASAGDSCTLTGMSGSTNYGKFWKRWEYQTPWPASWEICMQVKKQQLELDMEQQPGSKLGKEYVKAVYCHPAYLTYMLSTSCIYQAGWSTSWNQDCWENYH